MCECVVYYLICLVRLVLKKIPLKKNVKGGLELWVVRYRKPNSYTLNCEGGLLTHK